MSTFDAIFAAIEAIYPDQKSIPLHAPVFMGEELKNLQNCIQTTMVSSVGSFVNQLETQIAEVSGQKYCVALSNGTTALWMGLRAIGVKEEEEVITQPLTFVATANAIRYCGAFPVFLDVDRDTLGLSPEALQRFLETKTESSNLGRVNSKTKRKIAAVLPVHILGHPCKIDRILEICKEFDLPLVEDAAEAMGSKYCAKSCGSFGHVGVFSFNGNKIVTAGGGGAIVTNDEKVATWIRHVTTTAKISHQWDYLHDEIGYNFRLPNINAALAVGQMKQLDNFIMKKRKLADYYRSNFDASDFVHFQEPQKATSNYWLNSFFLNDLSCRDQFLQQAHSRGIMCRPLWRLMNKLPMYTGMQNENLENATWAVERLVSIPSSVPQGTLFS